MFFLSSIQVGTQEDLHAFYVTMTRCPQLLWALQWNSIPKPVHDYICSCTRKDYAFAALKGPMLQPKENDE